MVAERNYQDPTMLVSKSIMNFEPLFIIFFSSFSLIPHFLPSGRVGCWVPASFAALHSPEALGLPNRAWNFLPSPERLGSRWSGQFPQRAGVWPVLPAVPGRRSGRREHVSSSRTPSCGEIQNEARSNLEAARHHRTIATPSSLTLSLTPPSPPPPSLPHPPPTPFLPTL